MLLELLRPYVATGTTLLDVGGGIGVIDHELLRAGAGHATLVEASPASLAVARDEARRRNALDRVELVEGDFVGRAGAIDAADIVTLDRAICCYPNVTALVSSSAAKARRVYGLVLPRDGLLIRAGLALVNLGFRLRRRAYRSYAHPNALVDRLVRRQRPRGRRRALDDVLACRRLRAPGRRHRRVAGRLGMVSPRVLVSPHAIVPRVERQHALIELLRIRAPRTAGGSWMAAELGVSVRTVERDVAELLEAGVPIHVKRGPGGGYGIDARRELPTIAFTPGEASALIAAIVAIGPTASATAVSALDKLLLALRKEG